ncbi:MAG: HIT family protein [Planctomycetota bacterium]|nr:MAG: HIT family protein [Planctomycetota bacterium]
MDCIFCKIVNKEIPCYKVYEDEEFLSFLDIQPINRGHTLLIPKKHVPHFLETDDSILSRMLPLAKRISRAIEKGIECQGINILLNVHPAAGQVVFHTHLHLIPRFDGDGFRHWKGKAYNEGEADKVLESIQKWI